MKTTLYLAAFILLLITTTKGINAQNSADRILGKWYTEENKSLIEIFKKGDKYFGKIVWLKDPKNENGTEKLDKNNPDEKLRKKTIVDLVIMSNIEFDEDNEWEDGEIYDPESGNTYSCLITLTSPDKIDMRGYMGFSMFGRSTTWKRKK